MTYYSADQCFTDPLISVARLLNVLRIERVQNPHLWTKYCLRRHEVELAAASSNINEQLLFHGCCKDIMAVIGKEGFDIRVAGMQGSLGAGTYFAGPQPLLQFAISCMLQTVL